MKGSPGRHLLDVVVLIVVACSSESLKVYARP